MGSCWVGTGQETTLRASRTLFPMCVEGPRSRGQARLTEGSLSDEGHFFGLRDGELCYLGFVLAPRATRARPAAQGGLKVTT
jgi:hypothetical protein